MKKLWVCSLLILAACQSDEQTERPADVLPPDTMVKVLTQLHLAEARASQAQLQGDSSLVYFRYLRDGVFARYKLDTGSFNRSFRWYAAHPEATDALYTRVVDSLGVRESTGKIE